ncbi:MAG TPA: nucleoside phosphorylase [Acidimicrobiales bacterium]|jgi:uridine phosphorylase|nr:nucleoside phosphorylase [Acidimicrobiales bacterium]
MTGARPYHLGFGADDLAPGTTIALLSGDPGRTEAIATATLTDGRSLSTNRGLASFRATLPGGAPVVCATSGMGAPSLSIVVNELVQVGITTIIRVGTCGSIRPEVAVGSVIVASAALADQGAADDIAPREFPAAADPFLTVALARAAEALGVDHHVGVLASTDTFYEGQERTTSSANPHLLHRLHGRIDELVDLGILGFEMEAGTLFKMGEVYGFKAGCVCAVIAGRQEAEEPDLDAKAAAVDQAVSVAVAAADAVAGPTA